MWNNLNDKKDRIEKKECENNQYYDGNMTENLKIIMNMIKFEIYIGWYCFLWIYIVNTSYRWRLHRINTILKENSWREIYILIFRANYAI